MRSRFNNIRFILLLSLVIAATALISDRLYFSNMEWKFRTSNLDKKLTDSEKRAVALIEETEGLIETGTQTADLFLKLKGRIGENEGLTLLLYNNGNLEYWSDNSVAFPSRFQNIYNTHKPVFISNGWFIPVHRKAGRYDLLALICVYRQYPIRNNLLKSGFPESFRLPGSTTITFDETASPFRIEGVENEFHFGLLFPDKKPNTFFIAIPVLFWVLLLLLLIKLTMLATEWIGSKVNTKLYMPSGILILLLLYIILLTAGVPPSISSTELFSPFFWSSGLMIPSVGYLLLLGILSASAATIVFRANNEILSFGRAAAMTRVVPVTLMVVAFLSFLATASLFRNLLLNSAINFEAYRILDINFMSFAGFMAIILLLTVPVILFVKASILLSEEPLRKALVLTGLAALVVPLACLVGVKCSFTGAVYVILLAVSILIWKKSGMTLYSLIVIFATLTALLTTVMVMRFSLQKQDNNLKVMAISLANDNDMVAEALLLDMWPTLEADTLLRKMMNNEEFSPSEINSVYRYLENMYFTGYWENYDLNIVICRDDSQLHIPEAGSYASNCFLYFDERIKNEGDKLTETGFWFMHNQAGRAYYLGRLYFETSSFLTNGLFIELVSHIETYQAGYPELLLDEPNQRFPKLRDISFAKYSGKDLVMMSGDYPYDNTLTKRSFPGDYMIEKRGEYRNLYYKRGDMTLVITTRSATSLDMLITFAYLFVAVLVYSFLFLILFIRNPGDLFRYNTFRRRLQLAFAAVLSIVFIIFITGALLLSTRQFKNNHSRILREKITSVTIELQHKLSAEEILDERWQSDEYQSLNNLLLKFSNVFLTDINLYRPSGMLLATSRPEVFSQKLKGTMINPSAFVVLTQEKKNEFIDDEKIGNLRYLSAYVPFYNENGVLLAYVNLPYFAMQNILAGEISNLVVTLINFTLLFMMLMMWFAVFLSERITSPLTLVQRAMASVEYGIKNEHIHYHSDDEVGELVRQYNRMVDELEESAGKLARSEREMAWREMARQIAHEIKNPLTPMKLNVQQLYKSWSDQIPDFGNKLKKFTDNQIEYIDNLSNIASAFSYFARLPGAEPAEVDVIAQLRTTLEMFGNSGGADIITDTGNLSKAVVMADREHLNGIFSNLVKNALQAIPSSRKGLIRINVTATFDKVKIEISDNGSGIPDEVIPKMFTPNFTTKSSGMGLGLSIVKRYVETAGGIIWFESEHDRGTSFFIELPLLYTVERMDKKD